MSEAEERLPTRMKELAPKKGYTWVECLPEEDLARAEAMLGFPLPSLLRRIYLEVGDGAFGLPPLYLENFNGLCDMALDVYALEAPSFQQWLQAVLDGMLHFDWDMAERVTI